MDMEKAYRIYANGDSVSFIPVPAEIEYNKQFRFGCAMVVGKKCIYNGHVDKEVIRNFIKNLK